MTFLPRTVERGVAAATAARMVIRMSLDCIVDVESVELERG